MSFRVFGNSPETAWRAAHSRQAAHVILVHFLGSMRNRLTMNPCTCTPISGFYDKLPSGHAHPPGDASQIGSVLMFCVIWIDSDRVKL